MRTIVEINNANQDKPKTTNWKRVFIVLLLIDIALFIFDIAAYNTLLVPKKQSEIYTDDLIQNDSANTTTHYGTFSSEFGGTSSDNSSNTTTDYKNQIKAADWQDYDYNYDGIISYSEYQDYRKNLEAIGDIYGTDADDVENTIVSGNKSSGGTSNSGYGYDKNDKYYSNNDHNNDGKINDDELRDAISDYLDDVIGN